MLNYPENLTNEISAYRLNEKGLSGYYPIGVSNFWHSGIHLSISSDTPVKPLISGKVIAYRIDKFYQTVSLPQKLTKEKLNEKYCKHKNFYVEKDDVYYVIEEIPASERKINLASNFILLEHFIQDNDGKNSLKFYTLYTNIGSSREKHAYQEDFITDGKIHILKEQEKFFCSQIGPAGYDRDEKYIEISCFMEKSLFDYKFNTKKQVFLSAKNYKDFYSRKKNNCENKSFYFTTRSRYTVKEIITSENRTAKKIQLISIAAYLDSGVDTLSKNKKETTIKDNKNIEKVILNTTKVFKGKTSDFNLINTSLDLFFNTCKDGKKYTVTNVTESGQTQILIDCSSSNPVWIVDNNDFTSEIDKESVYTKNGDIDYYEDCPLFYTFSEREITETDKIKGLMENICLDKNINEYCEVDGLPGVYVEKHKFEENCYENALNWKAFFDNQEEFEDDIFCDKLSLLKKIDESSVLKNIFKRRMITDDEMEMFFGPNDHSPEMKDVVRNLRKIECKHPLEFDKAKFEKISDEYSKRKEWTMGAMSEAYANELKVHAKIRDVWTDGLCKIFKKNNFFFVHPIYFLNHLDKAGLFEFNPYEGKKYKDVYKTLSELKKIYDQNSTAVKKADRKIDLPDDWKVVDNPGFSTCIKNNTKLQGYGKVTGLFNEDYLGVTRYVIDGVKHPYSEYRYYYYHFGIDFEGDNNTEIKSFIYGTVVAMNWISSNGRCLLVQGKTSKNLYMLCHLSSYSKDIKVGTEIYPGQIVAKVGGSGGGFDKEGTDCNSETAFSPHLHISVIPCKENVDLSDVQINKSKKVACTKNKEEWINLKNEYKIYIDPFNYNKEGGGYAEK